MTRLGVSGRGRRSCLMMGGCLRARRGTTSRHRREVRTCRRITRWRWATAGSTARGSWAPTRKRRCTSSSRSTDTSRTTRAERWRVDAFGVRWTDSGTCFAAPSRWVEPGPTCSRCRRLSTTSSPGRVATASSLLDTSRTASRWKVATRSPIARRPWSMSSTFAPRVGLVRVQGHGRVGPQAHSPDRAHARGVRARADRLRGQRQRGE